MDESSSPALARRSLAVAFLLLGVLPFMVVSIPTFERCACRGNAPQTFVVEASPAAVEKLLRTKSETVEERLTHELSLAWTRHQDAHRKPWTPFGEDTPAVPKAGTLRAPGPGDDEVTADGSRLISVADFDEQGTARIRVRSREDGTARILIQGDSYFGLVALRAALRHLLRAEATAHGDD